MTSPIKSYYNFKKRLICVKIKKRRR